MLMNRLFGGGRYGKIKKRRCRSQGKSGPTQGRPAKNVLWKYIIVYSTIQSLRLAPPL